MSSHWTYKEFEPDDDLYQGDILLMTPDLELLFKNVHPHFCDSKYIGFMVLSQTCDLSRRDGGPCSTKYINLATIRPLASVINELIETACKSIGNNIYSEKYKNKCNDLLSRLFNQNEQKLGLFYLYPDAGIGIIEDSIAYLRVSVAFKSEHYPIIQTARRGRLEATFSNKLGWLIGNLYSRVGTKDWPKEQLERKLKEYLQDEEIAYWASDNLLKKPEAQDLLGSGRDRSSIIKDLKQIKIDSIKKQAFKRIIEIIKEVEPGFPEKSLERVEKRLNNDMQVSSAIKN